MADNVTTTSSGTGALPNNTTIATRDTGSSHFQQVDVAPCAASAVSGGQYALSVGTGAAVTLTVPGTATHCWVSVDTGGNAIRWTRDGTTPTSTVGHYLPAGDSIELDNLSSLKFLGIGGTATIQVSYHRYI